jgi:hypothetical protein
VGLNLDRIVTYRPDKRLFVASLLLSVATFAVYSRYFDILAPFIPSGSVRDNSGLFFALPVFILLGGQTLFDMWFTHAAIKLATPERRDALRAYLVAAIQILLFSGYYVLFPHYGPYIYIVYWMPGLSFGRFAYPIVIAWTLAVILGTFLVTEWAFKSERGDNFGVWKRLLLAAGTLTMIMVIAS